jgi:hypothetical protein
VKVGATLLDFVGLFGEIASDSVDILLSNDDQKNNFTQSKQTTAGSIFDVSRAMFFFDSTSVAH